MNVEQQAEQVRQKRKQFGRASRGRPVPETLRREAVSCWRELREQGRSAGAAAVRLGFAVQTLERWSGQERRLLRAVVIEGEPKQSQWVVHGPCGLRIEGLDMAGLAELLRRLA